MIKFLLSLSVFLVVEATINVCIPPPSNATAESNYDILKGIHNDIAEKLTVNSDINIGHIDLDINHEAIRLVGPLDNVVVHNLDNFTICFLENIFVNSSYYQFDIFNLTFMDFKVNGNYNLTGDLGDFFDLYGDGLFWIEFKNFSIAMVNFTFDVGEEVCFPINIDIDIQAMDNHLSNLMHDDELEDLFNRGITAIVPEALEIVWQELKEIFDKPLEDLINDILHHRTIDVQSIIKEVKTGQMEQGKYCFTSKQNN